MADSSSRFVHRDGDRWISFPETTGFLVANRTDEVLSVLEEAERWTDRGGWASIAVAYEAAGVFDAALVTRPPEGPLVRIALHAGAPMPFAPEPTGPVVLPIWQTVPEEPWYRERFAEVREALGRGDLYQANLTFPMEAEGVDPDGLFRACGVDDPPRHAAFLPFPDATIVCLSPETHWERDGERLVCRPMKGTALPDAPPESLTQDEKSRAENLMIADMVRADLGRIARPGSVRATRLFALDRLPTVLQMSTEIVAESAAGLGERFRALFPCASVTGAPRVEAMRRLAGWEIRPRGLYCGAVGFLGPGIDRIAVAIRTATIAPDGRGRYGVGSGLVWDSDPESEYAECLRKAEVLRGTPFRWLETFRAGAEGPHLDRIARSAGAVELPFNRAATEAALVGHEGRVRLTVDRAGRPEVASGPLDPWPPLLRVAVETIRPTAWHRVKTTRRTLYDAALARHPEHDEVLLIDGNGRILEFCRGNALIRIGTEWTTPPHELGLLPGIGARGYAERVTRLDEAEELRFVNALRGEIPVRVEEMS